jgi:hypothetical protein
VLYVAWEQEGSSPSPNPLPLGEGAYDFRRYASALIFSKDQPLQGRCKFESVAASMLVILKDGCGRGKRRPYGIIAGTLPHSDSGALTISGLRNVPSVEHVVADSW